MGMGFSVGTKQPKLLSPDAFLKLKICQKCFGGGGSAPDPAGGAYSAPPDLLDVMPTSKGRGGKGRRGKGRGGKGGEGKGEKGGEKGGTASSFKGDRRPFDR